MIKVIGSKRIVILVALITVNVVMACAIYLYVIPEKDTAERRLRGLRGQVSTVRGDIRAMEIEFEQLEEQQDRFDSLKADGFFSNQVRSKIKPLLSKIQEDSKVISAVVNVRSGTIEEHAEAKKSLHKILRSPIDVTIKAFDDADVYRYLDLAEKRFPGHLSLDSVTLKRTREVSSVVLRAVASGASPEFITAQVKMSWRTFIPENQIIEDKK